MGNPGQQKKVLKERYVLISKIGAGSFGKIYKVYDEMEKVLLAVKREPHNAKQRAQAQLEWDVYQRIHETEGVPGFPRAYDIFVEYDSHWLVFDLLGPNLEHLYNYCDRKFSLKTVLMIGTQLMERIRYLHQKHCIHRDIKPDNFLIGTESRLNVIHIIDFGLSKQYIQMGQHIPYKTGRELTGTARYASINVHEGVEPSRRDDLESIGYLLVYFLKGSLPWQNMQSATRIEKFKMIGQKKRVTPLAELCVGLPSTFIQYIDYSRKLAFDYDPDYDFLLNLFTSCARDNLIELDNKFDWMHEKRDATSGSTQATITPISEQEDKNTGGRYNPLS